MEYITEKQANIIIDFVNNEIKKEDGKESPTYQYLSKHYNKLHQVVSFPTEDNNVNMSSSTNNTVNASSAIPSYRHKLLGENGSNTSLNQTNKDV